MHTDSVIRSGNIKLKLVFLVLIFDRMNGSRNSGPKILVLYQISNSKSDNKDGLYNCFSMPRGQGVTLASVKSHCRALMTLSHAGADGYHWRVRVDDRNPHPDGSCKFSWWDIQDENARLPVKEATMTELGKMFGGTPPSITNDPVKTAASGAMRSLGKAMNKVVASVESNTGVIEDTGPRICVIAFKLLDLIQMHDDFDGPKMTKIPKKAQRPAAVAPAPRPAPRVQPQRSKPNVVPTVRPPPKAQQPRPPQRPQRVPEASLMDFGPAPPAAAAAAATPNNLYHRSASAPTPTNETRAEKLKREYEKKKRTDNRVWDEVDQRWVTVDPKTVHGVSRGTTSAPPGANAAAVPKDKKIQGISLDASSTAGKSAYVATKMNQRVNEMKKAQQQALQEVREREMKKKQNEAEEDVIRQKLDPKLKAWSEEHGKKKQLRALLCNLHTILWPGAKWKPVSLGDILDDSKCKRCFHKASRVVHPDKTMDLDSEKRFLAKRIFDALSQAKSEFDEGKR